MSAYHVYLAGRPVGLLTSAKGRLRFQYGDDVISAGAPALSVRLPPRAEAWNHDDADAFFANLLPEDEYRRLLAQSLGVSDRNVAGFLGAIGGECAGAVAVWPEGRQPPMKPAYEELDPDAFERLLEAADVAERLAIVAAGRLSLAGTMEKLGLLRRDGRWYHGLDGAPTTHILKWPQSRFKDQNLNEHFCLEICRAAGLRVPQCEVIGTTTLVLVVERYDRRPAGNDRIVAVHQEDFCQAAGINPGDKYQAQGGPSFGACADILRAHASAPARELRSLLAWAVVNYLLGNGDGHGKNLSLLYDDGGIALAPFYDITCTLAYPGLHRKMAMSVGGEYRFAWIKRRHWDTLGATLGVPAATVRQEAMATADAVEAALPATRETMADAYGDQPVFEKVAHVITRQLAALRRELGARR